MDWGIIAKVVLGAVGIITAGKVFFDIFVDKKTNLREEYKFAKEFLDDTRKGELHPYTLGKGYQAIAGTVTVKASEIEYILSLKDPVQCLRDFILSKQLFERLEVEGDFKLVFKERYKSSCSRRCRKFFYLLSYFILAFLGFSPMILSKFFEVSAADSLLRLLFTLPFFGLYAWLSLKAYAKIARGEHVFNNQKKHTSDILLASSINGKILHNKWFKSDSVSCHGFCKKKQKRAPTYTTI